MTGLRDGRPRVLAFVAAWDPARERPDELARIRAELRGLGSFMTVLGDAGAWSFQPDDDVERFATDGTLRAELAARYDVDPAAGDAVLILDGDGRVRFAHTEDGPIRLSLGAALRDAGIALVTKPAGHALSLLMNRREWSVASLVSGFALALLGCKGKAKEPEPAPTPTEAQPKPVPGPTEYDVTLNVNGADRFMRIDARVSLLDALRERLGLPGTKKGCDHGQCGACTVHMGGRAVNACLTLAVMAQGKAVTTIEGLADAGKLHPVQKAFIEHDGFQCGYCTPGQIMSAVALLAEGKAVTDDEVRERMSGNLCRCGAYPGIVAAVQAARKGA